MKKNLLLMMCCPAMLAAQNGVTVSNLNVAGGTVTFNVSWNDNQSEGFLWSDTVWVFVEYNNAGKMERLPITSATATASTVEKISDNDTGMRLIGNARSAGSFSAIVQLLTEAANLSGICAYASNYPPVGEYQNPTQIKFIGTPIYKIVVEETGGGTLTDYSDGSYTMRDGYTIQSFTDATGAPGMMKCMLPATYTLNVSALSFCAGSEGVQFALSGTEDGRRYQLYRDGVAVNDAVLDGTDNAATFTGSFDEAGTYTAQTIADEKYCAIAMNGTRVVIENPLPDNPTVNDNSRNCPGTVTLSASSLDAMIDWYVAIDAASSVYTGASYTTPEIDESTTYYVQARIESTGCLSARVPVSATVNMEGCCHAPGATGVTFAAFNPCAGAPYGSTYTLIDNRDQKTYKIKYLPDDRYWMVQDLAFGEKCETKSSMGGKTNEGNITANGTYYGDCYKINYAGAGYGYNYTAAMNYGTDATPSNYTCSGTLTGNENNRPATCRGICPENWHIPSFDEWNLMAPITQNSSLCTVSTCWATIFNVTPIDLTAIGGIAANYSTSSNREFWLFWDRLLYGNDPVEAAIYVRCIMNLP